MTGKLPMPATGRHFVCAHCRAQAIVCRPCDHGNCCNGGCSQAARRASLLEAAQRYQRSRRGRQTKVTHQSSAERARCSTAAEFDDAGQSTGARWRLNKGQSHHEKIVRIPNLQGDGNRAISCTPLNLPEPPSNPHIFLTNLYS